MVELQALTLSRRGLVTGATAVTALAVLNGCGDPAAPTRSAGNRRIPYGEAHPDQFGDYAAPDGDPKALVVLVHGGFWSAGYGLDLMEPMAADLRHHGYATWNIEYRRLGGGGGWPTTFTDVAAAFDLADALPLPNDVRRSLPVLAVGHSAGGHLAAWAASRTSATPGGAPRTVPEHTFSLAGVLDLRSAARDGVGGTVVPALLGGSPEEVPERYRQGDPSLLAPRRPVTAVVADEDGVVPAAQADSYLRARSSPDVTRLDVPGDHLALIDPTSAAWRQVRSALERGGRCAHPLGSGACPP